jgi:hypothetical protein
MSNGSVQELERLRHDFESLHRVHKDCSSKLEVLEALLRKANDEIKEANGKYRERSNEVSIHVPSALMMVAIGVFFFFENSIFLYFFNHIVNCAVDSSF